MNEETRQIKRLDSDLDKKGIPERVDPTLARNLIASYLERRNYSPEKIREHVPKLERPISRISLARIIYNSDRTILAQTESENAYDSLLPSLREVA
jgi:hypothetical protein